jgi:hypothetical protein
MLGIAYAKRSLQGATRGRESGNLPHHLPGDLVDATLPPQSRGALRATIAS